MRLLLKLFAAPVMLALTILAAMLMFLFDICSFLLTVASVITALLVSGFSLRPPRTAGSSSCFWPSCFPPMDCRRLPGF